MNNKAVGIAIVLVMVVAVSFIIGSDHKSHEPEVVTGEAQISATDILLQGMVTSNGGKEIVEYGFNWGTSTSLDKKVVAGVSIAEDSTYGMSIEDVEPGKTYYYQAYAINDSGTGYGEVKEITVPVPPNEPPVITSIKPDNNLTVTEGETVNISAEAQDDKQVVYMAVFINDELKQESGNNTVNYKWDTGTVKAGAYTVKVTASDGEETAEQTITIAVKEKVKEEKKTAKETTKQAATSTVVAQKPYTPSATTPSRGSTPATASSKYPKLSKVNGAFGQFAYRDIAGGMIEIDPEWVKENIVTITLPGLNVQVEVHKEAAENFLMAFNYIKNGTAVINGREVPLLSLIKTMDGTFVPRHVYWDSSRGLSNHSWGTAIDINAADHLRYVNPATEPYDPNYILWEKAFKPAGFSWGNSYGDAMHFEVFK